jgi:hypothetical protein
VALVYPIFSSFLFSEYNLLNLFRLFLDENKSTSKLIPLGRDKKPIWVEKLGPTVEDIPESESLYIIPKSPYLLTLVVDDIKSA